MMFNLEVLDTAVMGDDRVQRAIVEERSERIRRTASNGLLKGGILI